MTDSHRPRAADGPGKTGRLVAREVGEVSGP